VLDLAPRLASPGDFHLGEAPGDGGGHGRVQPHLREVDLVEGDRLERPVDGGGELRPSAGEKPVMRPLPMSNDDAMTCRPSSSRWSLT
jgi:hypothetical protein